MSILQETLMLAKVVSMAMGGLAALIIAVVVAVYLIDKVIDRIEK